METNKKYFMDCHLAGRMYHDADEVWNQLTSYRLSQEILGYPRKFYEILGNSGACQVLLGGSKKARKSQALQEMVVLIRFLENIIDIAYLFINLQRSLQDFLGDSRDFQESLGDPRKSQVILGGPREFLGNSR